jgi:two-component system, NarL family, response regulator NreC
MSIRVMIADDHSILRQGLKALIQEDSNLLVVGEADSGEAALKLAQQARPDVAIMDVAMPGLNGIEATRRLKDLLPDLRVVALSMHSDRRFVIEMLRAGARGFVLKQAAFEELAKAIDAVMRGQTYLSADVVDVVVRDYVNKLAGTDSPAYTRLTDRERQVLQLLAEGNSTKEIAAALGVSIKTVETHRLNIHNKLGIDTLAGLTKFAIREGITTLEG